MFRLDEGLKVYTHRAPVEFRLSINGVAAPVEQAVELDPFAACVYVFSNRRRNRVKVPGWDRNGFWLPLKRLEEDRFVCRPLTLKLFGMSDNGSDRSGKSDPVVRSGGIGAPTPRRCVTHRGDNAVSSWQRTLPYISM